MTRFLLWLIPAVLLGQPLDADAQQVTLRATLQVAASEPYLGVPLVQFRDEVEKWSNKAVSIEIIDKGNPGRRAQTPRLLPQTRT